MQRLACFCVAIAMAGTVPAFASAPPAGALTLPAPPRVSVEYANWNERFHCALDGEAPVATVKVGPLLLRGDNSQKDPEHAAWLLLQAGHAGDAEAEAALGMRYARGDGVPQDCPLALDWSRTAVARDNPWAQANLGLFSELERVGLETPSQAVVGNHNVIIAQLRLGDIAHFGELGQAHSDQVALGWYRLAAEQGDALAEQKIGDLFWQGSADLPRDHAEAVRHYSIAANKGVVLAARQLAIAYANGDGAPPDDLKMLRWQRMAAEGGDSVAAGMLGYAIMIGLDGTYDFVEAATWLTLAAEKARPNEWRAHTALYSQIAQSKLTPPEHEAFRARLARWRATLAGQ